MGDAEQLMERLNSYYGSSYKPEGRIFLRGERLFLYTGSETGLPYDWMGLHLANTDLSLTIEGAQKLGTTASVNLVEISREHADAYYRGEGLAGFDGTGYVILRTRDRIVGPGLLEASHIKNVLHDSRKTSF